MDRAPGHIVGEDLVWVGEVCLPDDWWSKHELTSDCCIINILRFEEEGPDDGCAEVDLPKDLGSCIGHQDVFHSHDLVEGNNVELFSQEADLIVEIYHRHGSWEDIKKKSPVD